MCKFACVCKNFCATFCLCLCDVIATDVENVWLVHFKILPGFRPPLNRSFNMKSCRAICRFITKNELHGFIILYKTINVIIYFTFLFSLFVFVSSAGPYNILWVTFRSINCHMALSAMNYVFVNYYTSCKLL